MAYTVTYDDIADWYENEFLAGQAEGDPLGIRETIATLLGPGRGVCVEIGCGTGIRAAQIRNLGWTPVGFDLSAGMLEYARGRVPVVRADALRLPIGDNAVAAVLAVMAHTDMPDYPAVLLEAARILRPGGAFVHIGVHPCFCGGFADRGDPAAVVIRPGYRDGHWTDAVRENYAALESGLKHRLDEAEVAYAEGAALRDLAKLTASEGLIPTNYQALFTFVASIRSPRSHGAGATIEEVEIGKAEALLMGNHARALLLYLGQRPR